ncbi:hypothetical protein ACEPAI_4147 [Sanghuangporus weigelae]
MAPNTHLLVVFLGLAASSAVGQLASVATEPAQVINGIGASGAWWPNDLIAFPEDVRQQVADLLFDSSPSAAGGAGLTSYRYNVGGGGVFVGNPTRAPETFYVSPGVYNWSADAAGVYFLNQAAAYNVPVLTAFVNSAPPAFTSNERSCGGTILDDQIPAFAQYLADVIAHFRDEGVVFTHVSPMNEPDNSFGNGNSQCGQEGMIVTPQQRASVVNAVRSALDSAGLSSVEIMADESSAASQFISEAPTWLSDGASSISAVSHHQYSFADDGTVAEMGAMARSLSGRPSWFTEICCFRAADSAQANNPAAPLAYSQGFDPTMVGGLQLGQLIYQSFTQALDEHFDFWTALSSGIGCSPRQNLTCQASVNSDGWNDGLIYYNPDFASRSDFTLYLTKRYYVFKHFTRFAFMGSTRYNVTDLPDGVFGLVFRSDQDQETELGTARTSFILMNMGTTTQNVDFSQAGLGTRIGGVLTDFEYDWQEGSLSGESALVPPQSIIALLFN